MCVCLCLCRLKDCFPLNRCVRQLEDNFNKTKICNFLVPLLLLKSMLIAHYALLRAFPWGERSSHFNLQAKEGSPQESLHGDICQALAIASYPPNPPTIKIQQLTASCTLTGSCKPSQSHTHTQLVIIGLSFGNINVIISRYLDT